MDTSQQFPSAFSISQDGPVIELKTQTLLICNLETMPIATEGNEKATLCTPPQLLALTQANTSAIAIDAGNIGQCLFGQ